MLLRSRRLSTLLARLALLFVFGLAQTKVAYYYRRPLISRVGAALRVGAAEYPL